MILKVNESTGNLKLRQTKVYLLIVDKNGNCSVGVVTSILPYTILVYQFPFRVIDTILNYLRINLTLINKINFKLLALLGAWLGWQMLPYIILASSLIGAIIGISLILFRSHDKNIPLPFGPYLAIAGWSALIWGSDITAIYWNWAFPS